MFSHRQCKLVMMKTTTTYHKQRLSTPQLVGMLGWMLLLAASMASAQNEQSDRPPRQSTSGQLTLPFSNLESLGDFLVDKPLPEQIPIPAALTVLEVKIQLKDSNDLSAEISASASNFSESWQLVPVVGGSISVGKLEPPDSPLLPHKSMLQLLLQANETRTVNFEIFGSGEAASMQKQLELHLPPATMSRLQLPEAPSGYRFATTGNRPINSRNGIVHLPPEGSDLLIQLLEVEKVREEQTFADLPRIETERTAIRKASFNTRTVSDGSYICTAEFEVSHGGSDIVSFTLPVGTKLLDCVVNSENVAPIQLDQGAIGIPVSAENSQKRNTSVKLSYTGGIGALDKVDGKLVLKLPSTPLFIDRLEWQLELPREYRATAVQGNLGIGDSGNDSAIKLIREITRGEQPMVEVFYRKRGLGKD